MTRLFTTLTFLFSVLTITAQSLSIYSGFGRSSFDKNIIGAIIEQYSPGAAITSNIELKQSNFVPIGAQLIFDLPIISIGAEANYTIVPYKFDINSSDLTIGQTTLPDFKLSETTLKQLMFAIFVKVKLLPGPIVPYGRVGAGFYSGDFEFDYTPEAKALAQTFGIELPENVNVKNAIGVNLGAGVDINFGSSGALFGEIVYHFIQREAEITGAESFQANNYGVQIGYRFKL